MSSSIIEMMNGFGVGAAFAVGIEISVLTTIPEVDFVRLLMTMLVYGLFVGYIFQVWKMALAGLTLSSFAHGSRQSSDVVLRFLRAFFSRDRSS